jgi:hypothetical protein
MEDVMEFTVNNSQEQFEYLHNICKQHPGCKGCHLAGGTSLTMSGNMVKCLTGMNKKKEE